MLRFSFFLAVLQSASGVRLPSSRARRAGVLPGRHRDRHRVDGQELVARNNRRPYRYFPLEPRERAEAHRAEDEPGHQQHLLTRWTSRPPPVPVPETERWPSPRVHRQPFETVRPLICFQIDCGVSVPRGARRTTELSSNAPSGRFCFLRRRLDGHDAAIVGTSLLRKTSSLTKRRAIVRLWATVVAVRFRTRDRPFQASVWRILERAARTAMMYVIGVSPLAAIFANDIMEFCGA